MCFLRVRVLPPGIILRLPEGVVFSGDECPDERRGMLMTPETRWGHMHHAQELHPREESGSAESLGERGQSINLQRDSRFLTPLTHRGWFLVQQRFVTAIVTFIVGLYDY